MIEIRKVTRKYEQGENAVTALREVSLQIADQDFVAITGESGSGKSTLLHLLGGLDRPDEGEVIVGGLSLGKAGERELTLYRRQRLGIVFQFFNLLPTLNVLENVSLPLELQGRNSGETKVRAQEMLELVGMLERARHFSHQLSGGEMQRAAIARALVHRPELVLADEPTGNLDTENAEQVLEVFQRIHAERLATLIVVTHSRDVAGIAQRTVRLRGGRIVSDEILPLRQNSARVDQV